MNNIRNYPYLLLSALCMFGCQRNGSQVWDDTKSASRHAGRAFNSLLGRHGDSQQIHDEDEFINPNQTKSSKKISSNDNDSDDTYLSAMDGLTQPTSKYSQPERSPGQSGSEVPAPENFQEPTGNFAKIFEKIYFETDDHTINNQQMSKLKIMAAELQKDPNLYVIVEGHCDDRASLSYNFALGNRRSNTVRNYLIDCGVNPDHVFSISYGKERPIAIGTDDASRSLNRRCQFKLYKKT